MKLTNPLINSNPFHFHAIIRLKDNGCAQGQDHYLSAEIRREAQNVR